LVVVESEDLVSFLSWGADGTGGAGLSVPVWQKPALALSRIIAKIVANFPR
jgi:hypothetical protein